MRVCVYPSEGTLPEDTLHEETHNYVIDEESVQLGLDRTCAVARMIWTSVERSWIYHRREVW